MEPSHLLTVSVERGFLSVKHKSISLDLLCKCNSKSSYTRTPWNVYILFTLFPKSTQQKTHQLKQKKGNSLPGYTGVLKALGAQEQPPKAQHWRTTGKPGLSTHSTGTTLHLLTSRNQPSLKVARLFFFCQGQGKKKKSNSNWLKLIREFNRSSNYSWPAGSRWSQGTRGSLSLHWHLHLPHSAGSALLGPED